MLLIAKSRVLYIIMSFVVILCLILVITALLYFILIFLPMKIFNYFSPRNGKKTPEFAKPETLNSKENFE